jgi:hypothetical protein
MSERDLSHLDRLSLRWWTDGTPGLAPDSFTRHLMRTHKTKHRDNEWNLCPLCRRERPAARSRQSD